MQTKLILSQYLNLLRPYRKKTIILITVFIVAALSQLPLPIIFRMLIDTVIPQKNNYLLIELMLGLTCLIIAGALLTLLGEILSIRTHQRFRSGLRQALYSQVQHLPFEQYSQFMSGDLTSRLTRDLDCLSLLLPSGIANFIKNAVFSFGLILILFFLNWRMTLSLSITLPIFFIIFVKVKTHLQKLSEQTHQKHTLMQAGLQEKVEGLRDIQLNNAQAHQEAQAKVLIEDSEEARSLLNIKQAKVNASMAMFQVIGTFVIWGIGGWFAIHNKMTIGELIGFSYAVNFTFGPMMSVFNYFSGIPFELTVLARIAQIFNIKNRNSITKFQFEPIHPCQGNVCFEAITFGYPGSANILTDITISVEPGQSLCVLGSSGSGKTTLLSLLLKLYSPKSGRILIDGTSIENIPDELLRQWIGFVPQDVFLFQGTLKDNILMGRSVSVELWQKACALSGVDQLILRLDKDIDTPVGEKGSYLSGGERQRVAIARALLTDPQIIVLDEPSNNLDGESKVRIQQSIVLAKQGKTIILVTHDEELAQGVDQVITLKKNACVFA